MGLLPLVDKLSYLTLALNGPIRLEALLLALPLAMRPPTPRNHLVPINSHSGDGCHSLETCRVPDHLVQGVDNLCKARPAVTVLLPTVQHKLV